MRGETVDGEEGVAHERGDKGGWDFVAGELCEGDPEHGIGDVVAQGVMRTLESIDHVGESGSPVVHH